MKNLTLSVNEADLKAARRVALENDTSVNAIIRKYLEQIAQGENRVTHARKQILALSRKSKAEIGARSLRREDLYDR